MNEATEMYGDVKNVLNHLTNFVNINLLKKFQKFFNGEC